MVLDTGAASRGSGNTNRDKEKVIRQWFVEQDVIEAALLLPEHLFYNTPAAGIVMFLNRSKPEEHKDRILVVNASSAFAKGKPKNYLPEAAMDRIVDVMTSWAEVEGFSRVVTREEVADNDFNIAPSRYVQVATALEYRPVESILDELETLEEQASEATAALREVLQSLREAAR